MFLCNFNDFVVVLAQYLEASQFVSTPFSCIGQVVQVIVSHSLQYLYDAGCAVEKSIRGYDHRRLPILFSGRMVASFQIPRTTPLEQLILNKGWEVSH